MRNTIITIFTILIVNSIDAQFCSSPNSNFCEGNKFTNGNFESITGDPNTEYHRDINLATGWLAPWGNSRDNFADLACPGTPQREHVTIAPSPNSGVYAGMWIINSNNSSEGATYREGMYNKLVSPISRNTGQYSFTFDIAKGANSTDQPVKIVIYGVHNPNGIIAPSPSSLFSPSNLDLFGAGNVVKLGTVTTPNSFSQIWVAQNIAFNSNAWSMNNITHILITSDNELSSQKSKHYINFDNFCMRSATRRSDTCNITCCIPDFLRQSSFLKNQFNMEMVDGNAQTYKFSFLPTRFRSLLIDIAKYHLGQYDALSCTGDKPKINTEFMLYEISNQALSPIQAQVLDLGVSSNASLKETFTMGVPAIYGFNFIHQPNKLYAIKMRITVEQGGRKLCSVESQFAYRFQISQKRKFLESRTEKEEIQEM